MKNFTIDYTIESPLLMSKENPNGRTLEDVLSTAIREIHFKSKNLEDDETLLASTIKNNNTQIQGLLHQALGLQQQSMDLLKHEKGENKGADSPRIGKGTYSE